jgi:type IV pilus assembly protein PilN
MARINLLPWRDAERKRRQQEFGVAAGAAVGLALLLALATHFHVEGLIEAQQGRNQFLQTEIAALDVKIKKIKDVETTKASLIARMNIIQQLQESRPEVVHLFDELVVTIPDGVYLTRVEQTGRSVIVEGQAQSNARVSALMRNIEASAWVGSPSLQLIENKDQTGTGLSRFRLRFDQSPGSSTEETAATGVGVKPTAGKSKPAAAAPAKPKAAPAKAQTPQKPT